MKHFRVLFEGNKNKYNEIAFILIAKRKKNVNENEEVILFKNKFSNS